ncbi:hypothetical protein AB0O68_03555 [Streptomyces sp. NPDC087512]|uniref:hypothetical protein n=1 Tax=Streptomyces sp. NPDC087512 TaxID=3155059 RepID=UPI00342F4AF6
MRPAPWTARPAPAGPGASGVPAPAPPRAATRRPAHLSGSRPAALAASAPRPVPALRTDGAHRDDARPTTGPDDDGPATAPHTDDPRPGTGLLPAGPGADVQHASARPRTPARRPPASPGGESRRPRAVPRTDSRPLAAAVLTLLAVVMALLPAWPAPGVRVAGGALPVHSATAVPHPGTGYHDEDGCPGTCAAQARPRHDHLGERPAAPDHQATTAQGTGTTPVADGRRTSTASVPVSVSPGRTSHDRGRAPPALSGT